MNNISNKKPCNSINIFYPNLLSDNNPFAASSIQIPDEVLKGHIVTFLSFLEQSHTLARVSKAFNTLSTFAREEQDWRDHTVDATPLEQSPTEKSHLCLADYLTWQNSKPKDKSIDFTTSFIYLEVFNKKINFINKIVGLINDSLREFVLSISPLKQINIKQISLKGVEFQDDFSFEQLSKCQGIELLEIELNDERKKKEKHYVPSLRKFEWFHKYPTQTGFVHFLQKCKQVKINLETLHYDSDIEFLTTSINQCASLDPNFIVPLHTLQPFYTSLAENLNPILQYSANLIHFNYDGDDNLITENFINALAYCTRLEFIDIQCYSLEFHLDSQEGVIASQESFIDCHDQAFANLFFSCRFIRSFKYVTSIGLGNNFFQSLCSHPRIENVNISIVLSPQIFEGNLQCPSLKRFKYELIDYGEDGCFRDYGMFTKLGFRMLESANTVTKAVATFFPNLEEFKIYNDWNSGWGFNAKITDKALLAFSFLKNLKKLDFNDIQEYPSQTTLISWANHPKLETIKFGIKTEDRDGNQIISPEKISFIETFLKEVFQEVTITNTCYNEPDYVCIPKRNSTN